MPTPSPHDAPDPLSFTSTCPDDATPTSPPVWHPPPSYEATMDEDQTQDGFEVSESRSTTMSPRPDDTSTQDLDSANTLRGESEDPHKVSDQEEDTVVDDVDTQPERVRAAVGSPDDARVTHDTLNAAATMRLQRFRQNTEILESSSLVSSDQALGDSAWAEDSGVYMGYDYPNLRCIPTTPSSFLRPGSRFTGTQQSERQVYDVQVEIKHVDLRESFLCGYLRIQGLTEDHPTLTTYFEGEIIGSKYGFMTKHESWGANDKIDLSHWNKFRAFQQFAKQAKKGQVQVKDFAQKENIFMRWKEHFLVPDHRVRTINGASFEGFYYICFNQIDGSVSGIYFHSKSEKFQQLELKHVPDKGCFGSMEFR